MGNQLQIPLSCHFLYLKVTGCQLSCLLFLCMEEVGSLINIEHTTLLPNELATFCISRSSGLETVSIYGISGHPNLHGENPMGSSWSTHYVANVQPTDSEEGSSPVFRICNNTLIVVVISPNRPKLVAVVV